MNWHQGDYVTTVVGTGAGCDPSVKGTHTYITKNVHVDWPGTYLQGSNHLTLELVSLIQYRA
jgi:hypothetical protein